MLNNPPPFNKFVSYGTIIKVIVKKVKSMGKAQEEKISAKLKSWKEEVEAQVSSGLSVSEWCRLNDIPTRNYYYH